MAYTMTHILAAEEVLHELETSLDTPPKHSNGGHSPSPETWLYARECTALGSLPAKINYPTYILGSIAPDAVHAVWNYSSEMKERSHLFPEGLKWGKVGADETEIQRWLAQTKMFYLKNRNTSNIDFLLGYIVHILTDIYCSVHFYAPFLHSVKDDDQEKTAQKKLLYKRENYNVNYYLFSLFSKEKNLLQILRSGEAATLVGVIEKEVIEQRIEHLFSFEFKSWDITHINEQKICRIEDMERMIQESATFIKKILIEDYCLCDDAPK